MSTPEVKNEMEEKIKEMTSLFQTFSNSIQLYQYKEQKLENYVTSELTNCNNEIEGLNNKLDTQRSTQNILPPSFTGNNPASYEYKNNSKFSEALKTLVAHNSNIMESQRTGKFS